MSKQDQKYILAERYFDVTQTALDMFVLQSTYFKFFRNLLILNQKLNPLWMIENTGPFFFKYRDRISHRDVDFFIKKDWSSQMDEWLLITNGYGKSIAEEFQKNTIDTLTKMSRDNPQLIEQLVLSLLKIYCQYVQECQL